MPGPLSERKQWLLAALIPLVGLLVYTSYLGWFSRYLADDFCTAGWLNKLGFFGSQAYWRGNWSGRFSFFFTMNVFHLLGFWVPRILPLGFILTLLVTIGAYSNQLMVAVLGRASFVMGTALAVPVVVATVVATPNLYQSLLWQTGSTTYLLPLVLLNLQLAWMVRRIAKSAAGTGSSWTFGGAGILALVTGGFSETIAASQLILLLGLLAMGEVGLWPGGKARARRHILMALAGAIVALIIVISAPGNNVRQGLVGETDNLIQVLSNSARDVYIFAARIYRHHMPAAALAFFVPLLVAAFWLPPAGTSRRIEFSFRQIMPYVLAVPPLTIGMVAATMAPSEYALSSYPDARVLIAAHYWVYLGVAVWAVMIGIFLGSRVAAVRQSSLRIAVSLLILGFGSYLLLSFTTDTGVLLSDAREFAQAWDRRHQQLQQAEPGTESLPAASLTHMAGLDELERDSNYWVNRCVAMTYELGQVVAK